MHSSELPASTLATGSYYDAVICGGGLVGASLALALAQLKLTVALVEAVPFGAVQQPSFDERTTAVSNGTRRIFEALGVWRLVEREATPIRRIHISDKGRFGFARLSAEEQGLNALGFVLSNRVMGEALWRRLRAENIAVIAPARVMRLHDRDGYRAVEIMEDETSRTLAAKLIVAADGADSAVRDAAGIGVARSDYHQTAIVTNASSQRFQDYVAYERFTANGPIAVLPFTTGRVGLVWTLAPDRAAEVLAYSDEQFLAALQQDFGFRLGRFTRIGKRYSYPLQLIQSASHIAPRLAVIGNAAQGLHPIAGQGFNLGLRDAATLAEIVADAQAAQTVFDPGDPKLLAQYRDWRMQDRSRIIAFTDGLVRTFAQPWGPIKAARDLGLLAFDLLPTAKDALAQLSLGAAGRIPRLARGAPLVR
jgi:2-octaprenyl-6-methoxyphenol hydroxylase